MGSGPVAQEITFPNVEPLYVFDRDCLSFRAIVDGLLPVECIVTAELLLSQFGAKSFTEEDMRKAFQEHRAEIQALARTHIENNWINEGRIFLTTRFTRLNVTYGRDLETVPRFRILVESAHRMLTGIIGPNAETVNVEWSVDQDQPAPGINVRIADPSAPYSVKTFFGPKEMADPDILSVYLLPMSLHLARNATLGFGVQPLRGKDIRLIYLHSGITGFLSRFGRTGEIAPPRALPALGSLIALLSHLSEPRSTDRYRPGW
jgi:hypothetical protein